MIEGGILLGITDLLERAAKVNGGRVLEKKDSDGTVWVYRWEDTVEAELLESARELRAIYLESRPRGRQDASDGNRSPTLADVREVENWSIYRARAVVYGMSFKRRKHAGGKVSL